MHRGLRESTPLPATNEVRKSPRQATANCVSSSIVTTMFLMQQRWHVISFFHWPCEADTIQTRLPNGLYVDTFDGAAWIGLTPFLLKGMRPPLIPATLGLSFPEINLRGRAKITPHLSD